MRSHSLGFLIVVGFFTSVSALSAQSPPLAQPNDNRVAGGVLHNGVLEFTLDARVAGWRPDADVDSAVTVLAFAGTSGTPRVPGPLLRASQDTEIRITLRNSVPDSTLIVHGLRAGTVIDDTLHLAPGTTRLISFRAAAPGTYLYWAATSEGTIKDRAGRDAQLTGAIVIDPAGKPVDADERIFVITLIEIESDSTAAVPEDIWEIAVNGLSWPHTERLTYEVNDTVRFRWVNGGDRSHPMHLHGFHFRVLAKGNGITDVTYADDAVRWAVTEFMAAGTTFRMEWLPTRAGNWLMHCHMTPHIVPYPSRPADTQAHDVHDVAKHPLMGMAGLVMGITTVDRGAVEKAAPAAQRMRLIAQQSATADGGVRAMGYVLQDGAVPDPDSTAAPGPSLMLTRGVTTEITVVNRLKEPTSVHWHGIELQSVFDGVPGWSGITATSMAPLLATGDSFTVAFAPPRAGTYFYHTHMDEGRQLRSGLYGAIIVLEPGASFDPATDMLFMIGRADTAGRAVFGINGSNAPAPRELKVGSTYRLRIINILPAGPVLVQLRADSVNLHWTPYAKDGADLPKSLQKPESARLVMGVGEAYDFLWTPTVAQETALEVNTSPIFPPIRQVFRIAK